MDSLRTLLLVVGTGALLLAACGSQPSAPATRSAPGDAEQGRLVFESQGCVGCHSTGTDQLVGPGLAGLFSVQGPALPDGVDYQGKLPNGQPRSEAAVAAWIRIGGQGQIGMMSGRDLNDADMANLLAYLRTLE